MHLLLYVVKCICIAMLIVRLQYVLKTKMHLQEYEVNYKECE